MKEKYCRRKTISLGSKWIGARVSLVAILTVSCFLTVTTTSAQHISSESKDNIYDGQHEISIKIGTSQNEKELIGINADDDEGNDDETEGTLQSESTTSDKCPPGSNCCFQYTWPGHQEKIPETPANATCEYYKKEKKDELIACFNPMVYTVAKPGQSEILGTPPNFSVLEQNAKANDWNIYCIRGRDKACVTYTYYSNKDKGMTNQTKFCGVVTKNDGNRIVSGCQRENVGGYYREVCVCTDSLCNGGLSLNLNWLTFSITLASTFALSHLFKL